MWKNIIFVTLLIPCLAISCTTGPDEKEKINIEGKWEVNGLEQLEINNLNASKEFFLISTNEGLYEKDVLLKATGLQEENIVDVVVTSSGNIIAATKASDFTSGDTTIYKKVVGEEWVAFLNNYGGEESIYTWISNLEQHPSNQNVLLASGGAHIAKSEDSGESWESIFYEWETIGFTNFLKFDEQNIIWAGGENAIFQPTLIKSEDGGESWENLSKNLQYMENTTYEAYTNDIIISTNKSSHLLLGLSNGILKSTDNGKSWENIFNDAAIFTITYNASNPDIVYASGRNPEGRLFFLASNNFGDTWQTIEHPESPSNIYVNDMVAVTEGDQEVIYLGTNKGLYRFTVESD